LPELVLVVVSIARAFPVPPILLRELRLDVMKLVPSSNEAM
jgi:hypothetical protein